MRGPTNPGTIEFRTVSKVISQSAEDVKHAKAQESKAYRCIHNAIPLHIRILMQPMVRLAKCNARAATCNRTRINGVEAAEE